MVTLMDARSRPGNVALKYHRDREYGFSLVYPETWHRFDLDVEGGRGVMFSERPDDLTTHLSIEVRDLGTKVSAADLPVLRQGFLAGLRGGPGSRILRSTDYDVGFFVGLEAHHLVQEGQHRLKRWVRLLFKDTLQVRLVFQARSSQHFAYWLPSMKPAMTGFFFDGGHAPFTPGESAYDPDWLQRLLNPGREGSNDA